MTRAPQHLDHIGEVVLALRVLGAHASQRRREERAPEAVDRRVHLADRELVRIAVGLLDDALNAAARVAHDAPVAGGVVELGGEQRGRGVGETVLGREDRERFGAQQGDVGAKHDHVVVVDGVGERGECDARGVAGAARDALLDELHRDVGDELVLQRLGDGLGLVADDHDDALERQLDQRVDDVQQHRPSAQRVQDLRDPRAHAGSLASRQDHGRQGAVGHGNLLSRTWLPSLDFLADLCARHLRRVSARGRGFEPRLGTPKDPVLPLHHPRRAPEWVFRP